MVIDDRYMTSVMCLVGFGSVMVGHIGRSFVTSSIPILVLSCSIGHVSISHESVTSVDRFMPDLGLILD